MRGTLNVPVVHTVTKFGFNIYEEILAKTPSGRAANRPYNHFITFPKVSHTRAT